MGKALRVAEVAVDRRGGFRHCPPYDEPRCWVYDRRRPSSGGVWHPCHRERGPGGPRAGSEACLQGMRARGSASGPRSPATSPVAPGRLADCLESRNLPQEPPGNGPALGERSAPAAGPGIRDPGSGARPQRRFAVGPHLGGGAGSRYLRLFAHGSACTCGAVAEGGRPWAAAIVST